MIVDFSWYTEKKRVKNMKNSSDSLKWKTHVETLKETVKEINKELCAEASKKAFMQPVGKKNIAAGMLFEDFDRVETKMRNLHNSEKEMLKPKITNDHFKWHGNCNQPLKVILKQWANSNHNMEWVSSRLARNLKEQGHCLTLCHLEDKPSLGFERERQLIEYIQERIRRKESPAKFASLGERYNQLLDEMDKLDGQKSRHLKPDADERMRGRQNKDEPLVWEM